MLESSKVKKELQRLADPAKASLLMRFFKTGKGEYGEGDLFLGVVVPKQRALARRYRFLPFCDIARLLESSVHEHRFTALAILVNRFQAGTEVKRRQIFNFYLRHIKQVNNWDLVDTSAPFIVGQFLLKKPKKLLYKLASSRAMWERRIAMVSTLAFIRAGNVRETFVLAEMLQKDSQDLIHKACGWMLREAGKKNLPLLEEFLERHGPCLPRTMLRYAIEKFPASRRRRYLAMELSVKLGT